MAVIKCKMCGGDMELSPDKTFGTCEYCGSVMTLPKIDDDQRAAAFNRGNHFRRQGEFDKALAVYERIVAEDDTDAEAHWCCALCRFGIEYVEDPATYEYIPTCHRASFDSILEDVDYLAALEHSDGITRRQYQKDAAKIAEVQRGILATSQKEEPFDVFICYKETDAETGERSRDSIDAQEVYYQLTEKGYRIFFARVTLEDKAGTEYEPYIFAALNSAKVMIVLGEKPEHFSAVWVKNEWSRYLSLMKRDRSRLLLPCYKNMDPYDLPEQLAVLQSYDMGKIGFIQDLIRGVEKVLRKDEPKESAKETVVQQTVVQGAGGANLTAQLKRGMIALEDKDWAAADGFFDKALDMDAECAEAYFGKALAAAQCANGDTLAKKRSSDVPRAEETLTACERDRQLIQNAKAKYAVNGYLTDKEIEDCFSYDARTFPSLTKAWNERIAAEKDYWEKDRQMSRAVRYAKGSLAEMLRATRDGIEKALQTGLSGSKDADARNKERVSKQYSAEMEKAQKAAEAKHKAALERRKADYDSYCAEQANAKTADDYAKTENHFRSEGLRGYENSDQRAEQCRAAAEKLRAEAKAAAERAAKVKKQKTTRGVIIAAAAVVVIVAAFFVVTKVVIPGNQYKEAEALLAAGDYDGAIAGFEALGDYKDSADRIPESQYAKAEALLAAGDYDSAIAGFEALGDYKDSADLIPELRYAKAEALLAAGEYDGAIAGFEALGNYMDSAERIPETQYAKAEALLAAGDRTGAAIGFYSAGGYMDAKERSSALWNEIAPRAAVAAGANHTVGLRADGTVVAVGLNDRKQCDVSGWTDIAAVAAGEFHTVGLRADGTVVAVGSNANNQCDVSGWRDIVAVAAGNWHTVGLRADGTVAAVGDNYYKQCDVTGWRDIVAVAAGCYHTVGLRADGTVVAVGLNDRKQCDVSGWTEIVAAAGAYHTVGLRADGTVMAVGSNANNQCDVSGWTDIVAVAAGGSHTVGLRADGTVVAVGWNKYNQCDASGWTDIVAVSAGAHHTVGLRADGTVVAVGANGNKQCDVSGWTNIKLPTR